MSTSNPSDTSEPKLEDLQEFPRLGSVPEKEQQEVQREATQPLLSQLTGAWLPKRPGVSASVLRRRSPPKTSDEPGAPLQMVTVSSNSPPIQRTIETNIKSNLTEAANSLEQSTPKLPSPSLNKAVIPVLPESTSVIADPHHETQRPFVDRTDKSFDSKGSESLTSASEVLRPFTLSSIADFPALGSALHRKRLGRARTSNRSTSDITEDPIVSLAEKIIPELDPKAHSLVADNRIDQVDSGSTGSLTSIANESIDQSDSARTQAFILTVSSKLKEHPFLTVSDIETLSSGADSPEVTLIAVSPQQLPLDASPAPHLPKSWSSLIEQSRLSVRASEVSLQRAPQSLSTLTRSGASIFGQKRLSAHAPEFSPDNLSTASTAVVQDSPDAFVGNRISTPAENAPCQSQRGIFQYQSESLIPGHQTERHIFHPFGAYIYKPRSFNFAPFTTNPSNSHPTSTFPANIALTNVHPANVHPTNVPPANVHPANTCEVNTHSGILSNPRYRQERSVARSSIPCPATSSNLEAARILNRHRQLQEDARGFEDDDFYLPRGFGEM